MNDILQVLNDAKAQDIGYETKARITTVICRMLADSKRPPTQNVAVELIGFAIAELNTLIREIPSTTEYRKKDEMFGYCDALLTLLTLASPDKSNITDEHIATIQKILEINNNERTLENAVSDAFEKSRIDEPDIRPAIELADGIKEPYRHGLFFFGLHHYSDRLDDLTDAAKSALTEFTVKEFKALAKKSELIKDESEYLEFAVDVCKHYYTEAIGDALEAILENCGNNVRYYAVETLLNHDRDVAAKDIDKLARDLSYAGITHFLLEKCSKLDRFPKDCLDPDYLAKSDMVRWLEYPTELGKRPDKIELIGRVAKGGENYHVFKYMTDSDNLTEDLQNVWLVGWAGDQGGTFSTFARLDAFEKKTPEKTLKYITKKLL